jgi:hypothetical protein
VRIGLRRVLSRARALPADALAQRRLLILRSVFREMSAIDPGAGALFQSLFFEQAMRHGDLEMRFIAQAWETHNVTFRDGSRAHAQTARQVAKLEAMAIELNSDYATATLAFLRAAVANYEGHHREVEALASRAALLFRERCLGADWEVSMSDLLRCTAVELTGPITALCAEAPSLLRRASERADHFSEAILTRTMTLTLLAHDQPAAALEFVRERIAHLTTLIGSSFDLRRWLMDQSLADCLSYLGDDLGAWRVIDAGWHAYSHSLLSRAQYVRYAAHYRRGRVAVALAARNGDRKLVRIAMSDARTLAQLQRAEGDAAAHLIRGAIASQRGQRAQAIEQLRVAELCCRQAGANVPAENVKRHRSRLIAGPEGERLRADADAALTQHGVANPPRWAVTFAGGVVAPEP